MTLPRGVANSRSSRKIDFGSPAFCTHPKRSGKGWEEEGGGGVERGRQVAPIRFPESLVRYYLRPGLEEDELFDQSHRGDAKSLVGTLHHELSQQRELHVLVPEGLLSVLCIQKTAGDQAEREEASPRVWRVDRERIDPLRAREPD